MPTAEEAGCAPWDEAKALRRPLPEGGAEGGGTGAEKEDRAAG